MSRSRRLLAAAALLCVAAPVLTRAEAADTRYRKARNAGLGDAFSTGWYKDGAALDPVAIQAGGMKVAWRAKVPGQVYAQPVRVGGRVIIATQDNHVASVELTTGKVQWDVTLAPPWKTANLTQRSGASCPDLAPNAGVTSTPVLDPSGTVIYVVDKQAAAGRGARLVLRALRVADGKESWSRELAGSADNVSGARFNPTTSNQRAGLLFLDGRVYIATGAHCDIGPYRGWVMGVDVRSHRITSRWTASSRDGVQADSSGGNGIWQSGGALTSDGPGRIFITVGNGSTPESGADVTPAQTKDYGNAVVRLTVGSDGRLTPEDFYAPRLADKLNGSDSDLGSSPLTLLPDSFGTSSHQHTGVLFDKESRVFVVDRDALGRRGTTRNTDLQSLGPFTYGAKGAIAAYGNEGGYLYYADNSGLRAFAPSGRTIDDGPSYAQVGHSGPEARMGVAPAQGSAAVSSDGSRDGTGVVWVVGRNIPFGLTGHLMAFHTTPINGRMTMIYRSPEFAGMKFQRPLIADGKVIVGQFDGTVTAYVVAQPGAGPNFRQTSVDLGRTAVGGSTTREIDLLPRRGKGGGIRSLSVAGPGFSAVRSQGDLVRITFTPTTAGRAVGALKVLTNSGPQVVPLAGEGRPAGSGPLSFSTTLVGFSPTVIGQYQDVEARISNDTDAPVPVASAAVPAPFVVSAVKLGVTIPPRGSLIVPMTFQPTERGSFSQVLTVTTAAGPVSTTLQGQATGPGLARISPESLSFPGTRVGAISRRTFVLTNVGEGVLHLNKAKEPTGDFKDPRPIFEGTTLQPGQSITHTVQFQPSGTGTKRSAYTLTGDDGAGVRTIQITGVGVR
jgi:outer membrane protein assembly factor BamB